MNNFQEVNGYRMVRFLGRGNNQSSPANHAAAWGLRVGDVISGVEPYVGNDGSSSNNGDILFLKVLHIGLKCVLWEAQTYRFSGVAVETKSWNSDAETASIYLNSRSWRLMEKIPEPKLEQAPEPVEDRVIHSRTMGIKVTLCKDGEVRLENSKGASELYTRGGHCEVTVRESDTLTTTVTTSLRSPSGELLSTKKLCTNEQNGNSVQTWFDQDNIRVKEVVTIGDTVTTTTVEQIKQ
jgi:hypothetical protein